MQKLVNYNLNNNIIVLYNCLRVWQPHILARHNKVRLIELTIKVRFVIEKSLRNAFRQA
jgi:hypothetical protein